MSICFVCSVFKFREIVASPICGALAAGYLTVPTLHYIKSIGLPLPPDDVASAHAAAFLIGGGPVRHVDCRYSLGAGGPATKAAS
ncbi:hypothetical protein [Kumtagia ephedrae]|uniref:Uncharacterized protein n=1 Tax=Kumtagia ephedrae TaxID=2116701 RepID=A0A2P7S113_9HYPH|nr:hypothetical protein C7I84_21595 [Mesorhizobium ephedrae]